MVNVILFGGGFGCKFKFDFVLEVVILVKVFFGCYLCVQWICEDDLYFFYFYMVLVECLQVVFGVDGLLQVWLYCLVVLSIIVLFGLDSKYQGVFELGMGLINLLFVIFNVCLENFEVLVYIWVGWFCLVFNIFYVFVIQSFVGELVVKVGQDLKDYLFKLFGLVWWIDIVEFGDSWNYGELLECYLFDVGCLCGVIEEVVCQFGWGGELFRGRVWGIVVYYSFVIYVVVVIEVEVKDDGVLLVYKVIIVVDCGLQINFECICLQFEGVCVMGLGLVVLGEISFKDGKVQQDNFYQYELVCMLLVFKVVLVYLFKLDGDLLLGGVGEFGVLLIVLVLCNVIFVVIGKCICELLICNQLQGWWKVQVFCFGCCLCEFV